MKVGTPGSWDLGTGRFWNGSAIGGPTGYRFAIGGPYGVNALGGDTGSDAPVEYTWLAVNVPLWNLNDPGLAELTVAAPYTVSDPPDEQSAPPEPSSVSGGSDAPVVPALASSDSRGTAFTEKVNPLASVTFIPSDATSSTETPLVAVASCEQVGKY